MFKKPLGFHPPAPTHQDTHFTNPGRSNRRGEAVDTKTVRFDHMRADRHLASTFYYVESLSDERTSLADSFGILLERCGQPSGQTMSEGLKLRQRKGRRATISGMTFPGALDQAIPPDPVADLSGKPPREMHP